MKMHLVECISPTPVWNYSRKKHFKYNCKWKHMGNWNVPGSWLKIQISSRSHWTSIIWIILLIKKKITLKKETVRKNFWCYICNLPIKARIDPNSKFDSLMRKKLCFQRNKQRIPPLNAPNLNHLVQQNLLSAVNSHYTLALGKTSQSAFFEAKVWMMKRPRLQQQQRRMRMKTKNKSKQCTNAQTERHKKSQRQNKNNKKEQYRKKSRNQVGGNRKRWRL